MPNPRPLPRYRSCTELSPVNTIEIRHEMSWQDPGKAPVPFRDVAAYFSEEETQLLQEWQKDLYKNVMNEIHQALLSLGCKIHDALLQMDKGKPLIIANAQDAERRENTKNSTSSIEPALSPSILIRIKDEEDLYFSDQNASEETRICHSPNQGNADVLYKIKGDEHHYLKDSRDTNGEESNTCLNTGHEDIVAVVPFSATQEAEPSSTAQHGTERRENIGSPRAGSGTMNGKTNYGTYVEGYDNTTPFKSVSGKSKAKLLHTSEKMAHFRSQMWSESHLEISGAETTQLEGGFSNPLHSKLHQGMPDVERSDTYNGCESYLGNVQLLTYQPNTHSSGAYVCTGSEQSFCQNDGPIRQQKTRPEKRSYTCFECKKNFRTKSALITHQRTHTGERPFKCTECGRCFSQTGVLIRHRRTHTGERPYQCLNCEKSFNRKEHLLIHQRTHKRERLSGTRGVKLLPNLSKTKALGAHHPL